MAHDKSYAKSFHQQLEHQDNLLKEQDGLIHKLGDKVTDLHNVALDIHDELDKQVPLLHDLDDNMEENQSNISYAINRTKELVKHAKSNSCCVLGTIIFLIILLIILILVLIYI